MASFITFHKIRNGDIHYRIAKDGLMSELKRCIRAFIVENFLFGEKNSLKDDTRLLNEGILDSTGVLELVGFLEDQFRITVDDEDFLPENSESIEKIEVYITRKMAVDPADWSV